MRFNISFLLLIFLSSFASAYDICSITINSDNETNLFQSKLKSQDSKSYNFHEFVVQPYDKDNWFKNACNKVREEKIECDVLLISGHFGGTFFGSKPVSLSMDQLQKQSCNNNEEELSCKGLMESPSEVFLFGCNTLATKDKDQRGPRNYSRDLLNDGRPPQEAARTAEARYGELGPSNKQRMQMIFHNVPNIYGFHNVGPSGDMIQPWLDKYLQNTNYSKHLNKILAEKAANITNKTLPLIDAKLRPYMDSFAYAECSGTGDNDNTPENKIKNKFCILYNDSKSLDEKVAAADDMLNSPDYKLFTPALLAFFEENKDKINEIRNHPEFTTTREKQIHKTDYEKLFSKTTTNQTKYDLAKIQNYIGWMKDEEFNNFKINFVSKMLNGNTRIEDKDFLCSIAKNGELNNFSIDFTAQSKNYLQNPFRAQALGCIANGNEKFTTDVNNEFNKTSDINIKKSLWTAIRNNTNNKIPTEMKNWLSTQLNSKSDLNLVFCLKEMSSLSKTDLDLTDELKLKLIGLTKNKNPNVKKLAEQILLNN